MWKKKKNNGYRINESESLKFIDKYQNNTTNAEIGNTRSWALMYKYKSVDIVYCLKQNSNEW